MSIGLLGYGVVGGGVYELARGRGEVEIGKVLVRGRRDGLGGLATTDVEDILSDPAIDTVIEVIGGMEPAHGIAMEAIRAGKNLVTANKLMLSGNYAELMREARERGVTVAFSASVGGGVPYLVNLIRACRTDSISSLEGIMNGTTNFILSAMSERGADFDEVLALAQREGYAEADPSSDIDGLDARCKLAIAAGVAWGGMARVEDIPVLGIRSIRSGDIARFSAMGLCCKLIARAERAADGISASVMPRLFPLSAPEAAVNGAENILSFTGELMGRQSYTGPGAGRKPTAYAVYSDVMDMLNGASPYDGVCCGAPLSISQNGAKKPAYVRAAALDGELEAERELGGGAYIVKGVSPHALIAAVKRMQRADPSAFAAAIE